jgi:diguanylate cyclase (GGDEF)-like protein
MHSSPGGPVRFGLSAGLWFSAVVVVAGIVAVTLALYLVDGATRRSDAAELSIRVTLRALSTVRNDLLDGETAQRGYLLTSDPAYLEPYLAAYRRLPADLDRLTQASEHSEVSAGLVTALLPVVRAKFEELEQTVTLERAGRHREASALMRSGRGKQLMEEATRMLATIETGETRLRDARRSEINQLETRTVQVLGLGSLGLAAFVLVLTAASVRRLRQAIAWLSGRIGNIRSGASITETASTIHELAPIAHEFDALSLELNAERLRRAQTEDELLRKNDELATQQRASQRRADTLDLVRKLSDRLSGCVTQAEFTEVIERMLPAAVHGNPGALYIFNNSRRLVGQLTSWADPRGLDAEFAPADCWGLRRGRPHRVFDTTGDVVCPHVHADIRAYACMPLTAQGEMMGLLHLQPRVDGELLADEDEQRVLAEMLAITLANLRLRESLQIASVRDPLTGLFNRRYLSEAWELESARSLREGRPIALLMIDIDHFKRFNDTYGHEAGDQVLKLVGEVLLKGTRAGDVVCRFGGEEFIVVLNDAHDENALMRAEALRNAVKMIALPYGAELVGSVTVSIGLATFPLAGTTFDAVQRAADAALYRAKAAGRDRVEVALVNEPVL